MDMLECSITREKEVSNANTPSVYRRAMNNGLLYYLLETCRNHNKIEKTLFTVRYYVRILYHVDDTYSIKVWFVYVVHWNVDEDW